MKLDSNITSELKAKYESIDQDLEVHLEGLLHSKPINYWDYIQTDVLLICKNQELIFLMKWCLLCIIKLANCFLR